MNDRKIINGIYCAEDIVTRLELSGVKSDRVTGGWNVQCPAHKDNTPSCNIADGSEGKILVKCYAGCSQTDVINGLKSYGAWPEYEKAKPTEKARIVKTYDYVTPEGELLFQVCRMEPKSFRQRAPDGNDWKWSVKHLPELVPYRLPELIASKKAVFIVEGEKDADNLAALGLTITTFAQGAGKWRPEYTRWFSGRHVIILPDNDDAGRDHADLVAKNLKPVSASLRVINLPGLPEKGDVSDWIAAGGKKEDLAALIKKTDEWVIVEKPKSLPSPKPEKKPVEKPADKKHEPITEEMARKVLGFVSFPDVTDKGAIKSTIPNLECLMMHYGIKIRYNVISKDIEVIIPGARFSVDNLDNCALAHLDSIAAQHSMPRDKIPDYVTYIGDSNQFNPVANWIDSKEWDGVNRFPELVESLGAKNKDLAGMLLWRWMVGAVAAAYMPEGIDNSAVLVLQGDQYIGKTSWFWSLLGDNHHLGKEGAIINPNDKDTILQAIKYWLVELGELDATFRKSDIAQLKAFITKDTDEIRRPYARKPSSYPRRTMFFASVNPKHYLHDDTGNRRFWTIECTEKLNPKHSIDMQQMWAQIKQAYLNGHRWKLTKEEVDKLNNHNQDFQTADPIEELILKYYDTDDTLIKGNKMTASDVLISIGYERPNTAQCRVCAAILRKIFRQEPSRSGGRLVFDLPMKKE